MTAVAGALLALTLLIALADWVAVAVDRRPLEYVLKPATMVALGAVVLALDLPGGQLRWWYLAAIILSLSGDVFLMLPESAMDPELSFVAGLGSFLVAHVLYVVGMVLLGVSGGWLVIGTVAAVLVIVTVGRRVIAGARATDRRLFAPVMAYVVVIAVMIATSFGTGIIVGIVGALLFGFSDSVIGWTRFLRDFPHSRVVVMVTYHLGQVGLVLALATAG
ncbi:lysoplasmalogenase [Candidatus Neomicrothrix sp.]|uniref:lysoplasmalogenase n=1 Tax=Candidatus Neomicrothrix sp. TaxID=2719034 RepID=UPI00257BF3F7|nr:lysoplasmalogenase [Candidatus Microthrix sp.]MBK6310517.1 lysoplasmalogenase [Candidatus Microthrix sp.]MBK9559986.1 lysoplasmalogenase [Candidatus Microthrix sp.]HMS46244.1 lysoplasmalogenase [Candidatus Microthrix sp.]